MDLAKRGADDVRWIDRKRAALLGEFLRDGLSPADAMWRVISDQRHGFRRFRSRSRPSSDRALERRMFALLARVNPELLRDAREAARVVLASSAVDAARAIGRAAGGDFDDRTRSARVQLLAAKLVLEGVGVLETGGRRSEGGRVEIDDVDAHRFALEEAERILTVEADDFEVRDSGEDRGEE